MGVLTARDDVAYDFDRQTLEQRMQKFVEDYNGEVDRYKRAIGSKARLAFSPTRAGFCCIT